MIQPEEPGCTLFLTCGNITTMKKKRYLEIDIVKAVSALVVILIHVSGKYTDTEAMKHFWRLIHFAVGAFVLASGFLQANKHLTDTSIRSVASYIWKRVKRLALPYYGYVILHVGLSLILPEIFDKVNFERDPRFILETVTLHRGVGQNWIARIFILMALGYVIFQVMKVKFEIKRSFEIALFLSTLISVIFFYFYPIPGNVIYIRALTWFAIFALGIVIFERYKNKKFLLGNIIFWGIVSAASYYFTRVLGISRSLFAHKYPPTIYFVSYNMFAASLLLFVSQMLVKKIKFPDFLRSVIIFLSRHSYTIFFFHIIVLDALGHKPTGTWVGDFLLATGITCLCVWAWTKASQIFRGAQEK